ncbi:class I SAM-dependent RNA methyltransferase [Paucibacter sp. DJ2R-2]|uniref:THUMP domain-containing class I SAM-dependent RNA methyltransferase n=1 Tax=Paucibacter sp. DJ2R-2 TaxID=2893558 RepID=UPI0021E50564|nr:THUMP domain-containing protein [Paucibacter sp. DJ2R-2]MCV2419539.1 THUMP domain-containing protein [Paucibacter sp. DJ4R-1]MCV2437558.1 THUMP domain-containing protein [Paucibacter sp. DJ2R-2]
MAAKESPKDLHHLFVSCPSGVERLLDEEVRAILPKTHIEVLRGGIALKSDLEGVMKLNLECRLAQRVLIELISGGYRHEDDIYALARRIDWCDWITPAETIRVDTVAQRSPLRSLNFATLRVKDAICDVLRDATGERPSVDTRFPDLPVMLHLSETDATLYIDTSGEPLFKRGWREDKGDAPLKETLAAAMLAAAGWKGTPETGGALHDPCCGSGTIAVEAAQIACGMAAGMQRRFAFERQLPFVTLRGRWQAIKQAAKDREHAPAVPIFCSDVAFRMVDFARRNAERAGVAQYIQFNGGDALERPAPELPEGMPGTILMNPPYGERIEVRGKAGNVQMSRDAGGSEARDAGDDFFPRLAAHWKRAYTQNAAGWTAWLLCPDMKLPSKMRLKESRKFPMWNGPIECRLFRFDMVKGSARKPRGGEEQDSAQVD